MEIKSINRVGHRLIPLVFPVTFSPEFLGFVLFYKFFLAPGVIADTDVGDGAEIDDDGLAAAGLELHLAEVERGGLEGVEEESGDLGIELAGEDEAHDLHKSDLDGVGVLEHGHGEAVGGRGLGVQGNALALPFLVKETIAAIAKSRGAALGAIGFDMSAPRDVNVVQHEEAPPPPYPASNEINKLRGQGGQNL